MKKVIAMVLLIMALAVSPSALADDYIVSGGVLGSDYTYTGGVLTVLTDTPLTISKSGDMMYDYTQEVIVADPGSGNTARVTIDDLYIYTSSENAYSPIDVVSGTLELTLAGDNKVVHTGDCFAAIHVPSGNTLTVQGEGSLHAKTSYQGAAIGGNGRSTGIVEEYGTIIFNSGDITAESPRGVYKAAAIGGGTSAAADSSGTGSVIVNGGVVTAIGTVGGGYNCPGGSVTVNGGKLIAAHVGSGLSDYNNKYGGTLTIDGRNAQVNMDGGNAVTTLNKGTLIASGLKNLCVNGGQAEITGGLRCLNVTDGLVTIDATGNDNYPGVGGNGSYCNEAELNISGGEVYIKSSYAAGIGSGYQAERQATGTVTISGGTLFVESAYSYGIGGYHTDTSHGMQVLIQPAEGAAIQVKCGEQADSLTVLGTYTEETTLTETELTLDRHVWRFTTGEGAAHLHALCGKRTDACAHTDTHEAIEYAELSSLPSYGKTVYGTESYVLTSDVNGYFVVGKNTVLNLCLNGHRLSNDGSNVPIKVEGGTLNLCDCIGGGSIENLNITKKDDVQGRADLYRVTVSDSASCGVVVTSGILNMEGGGISGIHASCDGAGMSVYNSDSQVRLDGVTISGNSNSEFTTDHYCAALRHNGGSLTILNSTITNNSSGWRGAVGLYSGDVLIRNTVIENNATTHANESYLKFGGGVYVDGDTTLTVEGGRIAKNTSAHDGAGLVIASSKASATLKNVQVSENTATTAGGGVYVYDGTLNVSGDTDIYYRNFVGDTQCNLYLRKGKAFNSLGLSRSAIIYVTTEEMPSVGSPVVYMKPGAGYTLTDTDLHAACHQLQDVESRINGANAEFYTPTYAVLVENGTANPAEAAYGQTVTISASDRTAEGYQFKEWSGSAYVVTSSNKTNPSITFTMPKYEVSVAANYSPITYSIQYDLAGGALPSGKWNKTSYTVETAAFTLVNPVREGYRFVGWTGTDIGQASESVTIQTGSMGNRQYTAQWVVSHYHSACGTDCTHDGAHAEAEYTLWDGSTDLNLKSGGNYVVLTADVKDSIRVSSGVTLNLCLNGHTLSEESLDTIAVEEGGVLNLCDCKGSGKLTSANSGYFTDPDALGITGGVANLFGVHVDDCVNNGAVSMNGGSLYVYGGTFMNNTCHHDGGVIYAGSGAYVYLSGVTVSGNDNSYDDGHGVIRVDSGKLEIENSTITGNKSTSNGAVYVNYTETIIRDTVITGNQSQYESNGSYYGDGGGVYNYEGPLTLAGKVVVTGNAHNGVAKDVHLAKSPNSAGVPLITLENGALDAGSQVGVYVGADVSGGNDMPFLKRASGDVQPEDLTAFFSNQDYRLSIAGGQGVVGEVRYVITFDTDGGSAIEPIEVAAGAIVTKPEDPLKTGYAFAGWLDETGSAIEFPQSMPEGGLTLRAAWDRIQYAITYDLDGGSLSEGVTNPESYDIESAVITLVNPVREGYAFTGWTGTGLSEPTMTVVIKAGSVGERSYKATWKAAEYTITFADTGDSVIDPITADYGAAITAPADPVKTGYTFAGWDMPIPETMTAEDLTITAQWTVNQYTITFADTGDTVIDPITADYGTPIMPPANPMKAGFRFAGWDKPIPVTMPAQDMTITAQWTVAMYTITFADTGDSAIEPITGEYGMTITPPADPVKMGHTFIGWDSAIPSVMPAQDLTITALWSVNSYTITFTDTGDTVIDSITADYGTPITPPVAPVLFGHTFMGWHPAIPATMPAQDLTVTAEWMLNQYTITFDTDGGSEVEPITLKFGEKVTAPMAPRKDHHAFVCWEPELPETMPAENRTVKAVWKPYPNGGMFGIYSVIYYQQLLDGIYVEAETEIQFPLHGAVGEVVTAEPKVYEGFTLNTDKSVTSAELKPAETAPDGTTVMTELKLYYDRNSYTLTYENMGDSAPAPLTLKYGEPIEAPDAPVKAGSVFKGWTQAIPETMPAENLTIGAVWEAKSGLETKTEVRPQFSAADITQALKDAGYATVQAIETELKVRLERVMSDLLNTQLYDAVLLFSEDGGTTWLKADREHFPASGKIQVLIPVPENTDPITHEYRVAHMFASDAFGKTPGDVETPAVSIVYDEEGRAMLSFEVTGLSPVMVSWRAKGTPEALPQTGDHSHLAAYAFLMALAMLGLVRMRRSARKNG